MFLLTNNKEVKCFYVSLILDLMLFTIQSTLLASQWNSVKL